VKRFFRPLIIVAILLGAAPIVVAQPAPPANWPANLRWDLVPQWIAWNGSTANIVWPPNDGCAAAPAGKTLPEGTMIDRFGSEGGSFFSPQGESFQSRAVPYVCAQMDYRVYRILKPLPVKSCKAAPWFGEPGGAEQVQTADPAFKLVASQTIVAVTYEPGGGSGPHSGCTGP
jgi:hypothetical protein